MTAKPANKRKVTVYKDETRYTCQVGACQLDNGDIVVVFNETDGFAHLDFDSLAMIRSSDNGETWDASTKQTVWKNTHQFGSDTPSIMQLSDGSLLMAAHGLKRGRYWRDDDETYRCFLIRSDNKGVDWEHWSTIAYDPATIVSFAEPAIGRAPSRACENIKIPGRWRF